MTDNLTDASGFITCPILSYSSWTGTDNDLTTMNNASVSNNYNLRQTSTVGNALQLNLLVPARAEDCFDNALVHFVSRPRVRKSWVGAASVSSTWQYWAWDQM